MVMKSFIKNMIYSVINIVIAALTGVILLCVVFILPVELIEENVRASAETIQSEGVYPILSKYFMSTLDNWTDSIILMGSADKTDAPITAKAMLVFRGTFADKNPAERLIAHYIEGESFDELLTYPRYWHGYLIITKPLLMVMSYHGIRIVNGVCQFLLLVVVCHLLLKKGRSLYIIPWVIGYLMLMPVALAKCMEFSPCYYIFTIATVVLLLIQKNQLERFAPFVFLNIGILLAFFDFLSYPIATFGVPSAVYLTLSAEKSLKSKMADMISNGFFLILGYAGMWASKWVLASIITGNNVIADAVNTVNLRTSSTSLDGTVHFGKIACEVMNIKAFLKTPVSGVMIVFLLYMIYRCSKQGQLTRNDIVQTMIPYFALSLAPMVWYAFATNHSTIHFWFTNKACVVSVVATLFGVTELAGDRFKQKCPDGV